MKKLNLPNLDSELIYTKIVERSTAEDKKNTLIRIKDTVFERYEVYDTCTSHLENIEDSPIVDEFEKEYLRKNYNRNKSGYLEGKVVSEIIKAQSAQLKNRCPYCGLDKPRTIDHYLPQSKFPEYSVYPKNLIPCCGHCNSKKNNRWLKEGKRIIINYYYDELPFDKIFLKSNILFQSQRVAPQVKFELINDEIEDSKFELIKSHYETLNLLSEYEESVEEEISNIRQNIISHPELNNEYHKKNLSIQLNTLEVKYGVNYWKATLYRALIETEEFFTRVRGSSDSKVS